MNFSSAFKYPFHNFAKVMSIVLALTIAFAVFSAMILNSHDWTPLFAHLYEIEAVHPNVNTLEPVSGTTIIGIFGLIVVAIASGFWLSGYSIEVIRAVIREDEWMPAVDISRNVKDGALLFVSSVAYWLLFIALIVVVAVGTHLLGGVATLVLTVFTIVAICVMGWAYFVGMARFALEGDYRASWEVWKNMRAARVNWRSGAKLLLYMIAFSIVYGTVRQIADGIFGGLMGANLLTGITVSIIIYYESHKDNSEPNTRRG
ncbi:MAG: DUF4013 domain-containing protein, partial [Chloroflexi bacterium]|nr:DUF4013 domain-containing protein [Chloroflexota bacterium]